MTWNELLGIIINAFSNTDFGICSTYSITICAYEVKIVIENPVKRYLVEIEIEGTRVKKVEVSIYSWFGIRKKTYSVFEDIMTFNQSNITIERKIERIANESLRILKNFAKE
ncbi:hypothetical protein L0P88_07395 [Muricauda sp. SCSIO 64092]|uniref:hypothetical protein n=1 Tax=Allomuricauda sp. SCSIO 64092 TaxID=2908842 RepID=UPI001FF0E92A|nr:hypothetical protein [Muricauda sp. SCSIO 64092]UOY08373.1 hypothetical protein L0P88_07395 [Muricauda sp. SCSIO 64092]